MEHKYERPSQQQVEGKKGQSKGKNNEKIQGKSNNGAQNPKRPSQTTKPVRSNNPHFKFNKQTVEHLFFKKLTVVFLEDLDQYMSITANRGNALSMIKAFFGHSANLQDVAKLSHQIIEDFTVRCPKPKVPRSIVNVFVNQLIAHKQKIKHLLNKNAGDKLLDSIPLYHLVDIIELYDIKLSKKDTSIFFKELSRSDSFTEIPRLLVLTGCNDFEKELVPVIQRLIDVKDYKKLRMIPNLRKMFKENHILVREKNRMLVGTAFYHFRSEGWEYLQEIFQFHPLVIINIINSSFGSRPSKYQYDQKCLEGVVSICERNPYILQNLRPDTRKVIQQKKAQMLKNNIPIPENLLKLDHFQPSTKDHFNFQEFQITKNHAIWVDDKLDNEKLKEIKQTLLKADRIAIDTESTLIRTPIDLDLDVLSLIQVSTHEEIYLFDPYNSKHPEITSFFRAYLGDKNKVVVGHTISDDIGSIAHFFQLPEPICQVIDIKTEYEKFTKATKQISLKAISKSILGKQICKKYTMTNWDRRPLNMCQIHYAAMDAYIILRIWDKLSVQIAQKKNNPVELKKSEIKSDKLQLLKQTSQQEETHVAQNEEKLVVQIKA